MPSPRGGSCSASLAKGAMQAVVVIDKKASACAYWICASRHRFNQVIKATAAEKVRNAKLVDTRMILATRPLWAP